MTGVQEGDFIPGVLMERAKHVCARVVDGVAVHDSWHFNITAGDLKITWVETVPVALNREQNLKIRKGEMERPPDVYRVAEPYYPRRSSKIRDYALTFMIVFPSACRYATIDHVLGNREDNSIGMLHSVSTSENTRIMHMVKAQGGYSAVQALYAANFP